LNIQGIKNKLDLHNQRFEKFKNEHNNGKKKTDSENYENYINLYSNVPKKQKAKYNASILIKKDLKEYITKKASMETLSN